MTSRGFRAGLIALAACAALALSGCGIISVPLSGLGDPKASPSSRSGSLAVDPPPSARPDAPAQFPAAGECTEDNYVEQVSLTNVHLVDCAERHISETVYVGQFSGAAAQGLVPRFDVGQPQPRGQVGQNAAFLDCSTRATAYLGHSWIHMLVELRLTLPQDDAWEAGQRWYRCDLYQTDWATGDEVERTGSLKAKWFGPVCINQNDENWPVVDCADRHPGEFTGGYLAAAGTVPQTDAQFEPYHKKCRSVVGAYLGVSAAKAYDLVGDSVSFLNEEDAWPYGRRVVHCFLWTGKKETSYVTGSAKGRKGKGL